MRIAVCDDNADELEAFGAMLTKVKLENDIVKKFSSGMQILDYHDHSSPFDLLFLDVKMPHLSGLDVAHEICRLSPDTMIVVLTGYEKYARDFYQFHVYDYLLKPPSSGKISEILEYSRTQINPCKSLLINTGDEHRRIRAKHIVYATVNGRQIAIHTYGDCYSYTGQLKELAMLLVPQNFYQINRETLVNLDYVERVDKHNRIAYISSPSGKETALPISERRTADFIKKLTAFIDSINQRPGR